MSVDIPATVGALPIKSLAILPGGRTGGRDPETSLSDRATSRERTITGSGCRDLRDGARYRERCTPERSITRRKCRIPALPILSRDSPESCRMSGARDRQALDPAPPSTRSSGRTTSPIRDAGSTSPGLLRSRSTRAPDAIAVQRTSMEAEVMRGVSFTPVMTVHVSSMDEVMGLLQYPRPQVQAPGPTIPGPPEPLTFPGRTARIRSSPSSPR